MSEMTELAGLQCRSCQIPLPNSSINEPPPGASETLISRHVPRFSSLPDGTSFAQESTVNKTKKGGICETKNRVHAHWAHFSSIGIRNGLCDI